MQLLTDPERRKKFDNHGITEEGTPRRDRRENPHFMSDPLEELFSKDFHFKYTQDIRLFYRMTISYRYVFALSIICQV